MITKRRKFLPYDIIKENLVNCKFATKKSNLIYLKTKFRGPFRSAVGNLVFEITDL